ncbi:hypothetical protein ISN44_As08g029030 [Arabidopsis suecica]|uniref:Uncharacterized protein n=1 Tax=Arabidopsis suecica TaxID=45249 RepID=A0A8T2BBH0_ARASU|nr:hypothetical protein ISN44_As08g029030 [Arabidopsis suecica]
MSSSVTTSLENPTSEPFDFRACHSESFLEEFRNQTTEPIALLRQIPMAFLERTWSTMWICLRRSENLPGLRLKVTKMKGVMMENTDKALDCSEKIELLVDLRSPFTHIRKVS